MQCRLALHVMCFSNPKAVAVLWQRFVRHLREACWDTGCLLPRMDPPAPLPASPQGRPQTPPTTGGNQDMCASGLPRPDFGCCLLHQKLQMLNLCIHQAHQLQSHHLLQSGMFKVTSSIRLKPLIYMSRCTHVHAFVVVCSSVSVCAIPRT